MKAGVRWFVGLAVLLVGAGLTASPALAKCGTDCKKALASEFKACKAACPKGKAGKDCRAACSAEFKADKATCKAATNPTPPDCGETTTTTSTSTTSSSCTNTTTIPPCALVGGSCGGACPGGQSCQMAGVGECTCVGPPPPCSSAGDQFCAAGTCPGGQTCHTVMGPCGPAGCQCQ